MTDQSSPKSAQHPGGSHWWSTLLVADSAWRLFVIVTVTGFVVESGLMVILFRHQLQQNWAEILLDPTLMVLISFPVLYRFFLLPVKKILAAKTDAERQLSEWNDVLEHRVQERTKELENLNSQLQEEIHEHKVLKDELEVRVEQRTAELMGQIEERRQVERELENMNKVLTASSVSEREQRKIAEGLMEAAIALNSSQSVEEVLDRILDETQRVLPNTAIILMLIDGGRLTHAGMRGFDQLHRLTGNMPANLKIKDFPVLAGIMGSEHPILIADTITHPEWRPIPEMTWIRSFASTPLGIDGKVTGYLQIISDRPGHFTERTVHILNGFAAHAGLAIHNARLIQSLKDALSKELEIREELIRSEKLAAMGRTIASVAHELNNPIQTIKNCTFLLRSILKNAPVDASAMEMVDMVSMETQRISTLVAQLREFFRPNLNQTLVRVDLLEVVMDVSAAMQDGARASNVFIEIDPLSKPAVIMGSADNLRQVFINLFQNAIDVMHTGGRIEVRFTPSLDHRAVEVAVSDSGPGMTADVQEKIFEPFFSTKSKGMGLGLPIVFQIIERHGGSIKVKSSLGSGCTFLLSLPLYNSK